MFSFVTPQRESFRMNGGKLYKGGAEGVYLNNFIHFWDVWLLCADYDLSKEGYSQLYTHLRFWSLGDELMGGGWSDSFVQFPLQSLIYFDPEPR